ncbi:probable rhamnogalacturonate lyase B, partial [Tanacetum coccineum]
QADANSFLRFCAKFQDRKKDDNTYEETTWTIKFKLKDVKINGSYKLRPALASAQVSNLQQADLNNFSRFCAKFQER